MKIKKVDSKSVILHEGSKVTLKTCGDSREVSGQVDWRNQGEGSSGKPKPVSEKCQKKYS